MNQVGKDFNITGERVGQIIRGVWKKTRERQLEIKNQKEFGEALQRIALLIELVLCFR